jgi:hypothetical protein
MVMVGCNSGTYEQMHTAIPKAIGRRVYYDDVNGWPPNWPHVADSSAVMSIRPDPTQLLAGTLDTSIRNFAMTAPANSDLTTWHEAGNLNYYPPSLTPRVMTLVHLYMQNLIEGTPCSYGVIMCMPPSQMPPWMPGGLDWYGLDIYEWPEFHDHNSHSLDVDALQTRLDEWKVVVQSQTKRESPHLNVCETNAFFSYNRPAWFECIGRWLNQNGGRRMLAFYSKETGHWNPTDTATIAALKLVANL